MALITKPNTFVPGTVIRSAEVNDNFDTIYNEFNGLINEANLTTLTGNVNWSVSGTTVPITITNSGTGNDLTGNAGNWFIKPDGEASFNTFDITSVATTTDIFSVIANSLTAGSIFNAVSDSADASARNLFFIHNDNVAATGAVPLAIQQDADNESLSIVTAAGGAQTLSIIGDSLTTGTLGLFRSNSANASVRRLVDIQNDNVAAVGAVCLFLGQNSNAAAIEIDHDGSSATDIFSILITSDNAGAGRGGGIDFGNFAVNEPLLNVPTDNVDPTGGGGAAIGRARITVAGVDRYIAYY